MGILDDFNLDGLAEEISKDLKRNSYWQPKADTENEIRILPPLTKQFGERLFYHKHRTHWIDGKPWECLNQTGMDKDGNHHEAEVCPVCKMVKSLRNGSTDKDSKAGKIASKIAGRDRYVFRIIARDSKNKTTPMFYEVGPKIFQKITSAITSGKFGSVVHPVEGRDVIIIKTGSGMTTNYDSSYISPQITPMFQTNEEIIEAIKKAYEMSYTGLINYSPVEEMKLAVRNFIAEESGVAPTKKPVTETVKIGTTDSLESLMGTAAPSVAQPEEITTNNEELNDLLSELDEIKL